MSSFINLFDVWVNLNPIIIQINKILFYVWLLAIFHTILVMIVFHNLVLHNSEIRWQFNATEIWTCLLGLPSRILGKILDILNIINLFCLR